MPIPVKIVYLREASERSKNGCHFMQFYLRFTEDILEHLCLLPFLCDLPLIPTPDPPFLSHVFCPFICPFFPFFRFSFLFFSSSFLQSMAP